MRVLRTNFLKQITTLLMGLIAICLSFVTFGQALSDTFSMPGTYTWTVPQNVTSVKFQVWGAGGGGGGAESHLINYGGSQSQSLLYLPRAGGGGGGAFASASFATVPGENCTINVGVGGAGGVSTQDGGNGEYSSIEYAGSTIVSAEGGNGGAYRDNENNVGVANGQGGTSGANILFVGGNGAPSNTTDLGAGGGGAAGNNGNGTDGTGSAAGIGGSVGGGNGGDPTTLADEDGKPGANPGGGGSGAKRTDLAGTNKGGNGGNGLVIVTYCTTPLAPSLSVGDLTPCELSNQTYTVVADANVDHYVWTLPNGWSGFSTTNSIDVVVGQVGAITVEAFNECGESVTQTFTINVNELPAQPSVITGNTTVCEGTSALTYSVTNDPAADSYTWTLPSDWTGTSTTNSINATVGSQAGSITVVANNACGASPVRAMNVTISALPVQPSAINGNTEFCQGDVAAFNVAFSADAASYQWVFPADWTGTSTTNSISLTTGAASGTVSVMAVNGCGNSTPQVINVTVHAIDATVSNANGVLTANQAGAIYLWIDCATGTPVANGSGQSYTPIQNGSYNVMITTPEGCTVVSECVNITNLGVDKKQMDVVSIYPNPASDYVMVANIDGETTIQLLDMTGKVIYYTIAHASTKIDLNDINAGAYVIVLKTNNDTKTQKLIVKK
ncbi:MAG: T9SS type A sorting domain-containing protein [Crocinitomicaceae bacterium]|nr:T9SS type A sorting domain-containing protein [Crocinitomicaceae bacterium]